MGTAGYSQAVEVCQEKRPGETRNLQKRVERTTNQAKGAMGMKNNIYIETHEEKMRQARVTIKTDFFRLQPGDGTLYQFSISCPLDVTELTGLDYFNTSYFGPPRTSDMIAGCSNSPGNYVLVGVMVPYIGVALVLKDSLQDLHMHTIDYLRSPGHGFENVGRYTVAAVMLAVNVLMLDKNDLDGACKAMLLAPEILRGDQE